MAASITAAACPSCIFGAVASTSLSFTLHQIELITVSLIPKVTVYSNGSAVTNTERVTQSFSELVGGANRNASTTYSDLNSITWTVGDATLTYPTTYIQYLGFEGAATTASESCAQETDVTAVDLPTSVDIASFIYPATGIGSMPLPTQLLEYLSNFDIISPQFGGDSLLGCAPLGSISNDTSSPQAPSSSEAASSSDIPSYGLRSHF